MHNHTNAIAAIRSRDMSRLADSFQSVEEANDFRNNVLHTLASSEARWFWQQVMTPEQLELTLDSVRAVIVHRATAEGLELGSDFSLGYQDGQPVLHIHAARESLVMSLVPQERKSMLRAFLESVL